MLKDSIKFEEKINVAKRKMPRWTCRVTKINKIKNDRIKRTISVTELSKKSQERSQWYGRMKRGEDYIEKRVIEMKVEDGDCGPMNM